ncbi:MAG: T9SS type A sorting domain-containing protein [Candidatus Delongbacteria bacterium]|nr:T9SS type A sorting domain-containing protein [Candidatus Delongbacteria bacterium]
MRVMIIIFMVVLSGSIFSQTIDTWERRYDNQLDESGKQIIKMNDGTFLINSNIIVSDSKDMTWLIAIDEKGDSLWTKQIYEPDSVNSYIIEMACNTENNVYAAHRRISSEYEYDKMAFLSKKTENYEEVWTKEYPSSTHFGTWTDKPACTPDSGCAVIVGTMYDIYVGSSHIDKYDKNGNLKFSSGSIFTKNEKSTEYIDDFAVTNDGDFITIVKHSSAGYKFDDSQYIILFDDSLNFSKAVDYTWSIYSLNGIGKSQSSDSFIAYGFGGIIKIDVNGEEIWNLAIDDGLVNFVATSDGNYVLSSSSKVYKVDDTGKLVWSKDFGCNSLVSTDDGGCIAVGSKNYDVWICKFDQDGNYVNINNYITGIDRYELYQNYPNPFNPETTIKYSITHDADVKITVFDIAGKEVVSLVENKQGRGSHTVNFNAENLTSGIYFYKLKVDDKVVASKSMILLK